MTDQACGWQDRQLPYSSFISTPAVRSNATCKEEKKKRKHSFGSSPFSNMFYICILSLSVFLLLVSSALFQVAAGDWEAAIDCASVVSGRRSWRRKERWLIVGFGLKWSWICGRRCWRKGLLLTGWRRWCKCSPGAAGGSDSVWASCAWPGEGDRGWGGDESS